jgi:hypothetical protein
LRKIFVPKGEEVTGGLRKLQMKIFVICTLQQILYGNQIKEDVVDAGHLKD